MLVLSVVEVLVAGLVAWMNVVRQSEGISTVPHVVPGTSRQGRCGGALLGTWVSVIAVVMHIESVLL